MEQIQVCGRCYSEENIQWFCTDCSEILCDSCEAIHLRTRRYKNDKIIPLKQARNVPKSTVVLFDHHPSKKRTRKEDTRKPEPSNVNKDKHKVHQIDIPEVEVTSVIHVKSITITIMTIVPINSNRMWISQGGGKDLTLIDSRGKVIKKSVKVNEGVNIVDVKQYNNDLLVICHQGQRIIRMSSDGTSTSTFSDIAPSYTRGLCIGCSNDVLVTCLKYTSEWEVTNGKLVRLNESGSIVQTVEYDHTGAALFSAPFRLTSLPSGDIIVIDICKIIAIDIEGRHLFTWDGEKEGVKGGREELFCIAHDRHNHVFVTDCNNDKVYVIGRDGKGGKCLLDRTQGISNPFGIAINHDGQLLVGCLNGKIYVAEY